MKALTPAQAHRLGMTHVYDFLRTKIGRLAEKGSFTKTEFASSVGRLHQEGGPDKVLADLKRWGLLRHTEDGYELTAAGSRWIEGAEGVKRNPLSNGETAFMLVAGAVAVGALAYVFWPKKASAATPPGPGPSPLPPSPTPVTNVRTLTTADDGKTFSFTQGESFAVKLGQQSGTGYIWGFELDGPAIISADLDKSYAEGGANPGEAQNVVTFFDTLMAGRTTLKAALHRGTSISQSVTFNIIVSGTSGTEV